MLTVKAGLGVPSEDDTPRVTEGRGGTRAQKAFGLSSRLGRRGWDNMAGLSLKMQRSHDLLAEAVWEGYAWDSKACIV